MTPLAIITRHDELFVMPSPRYLLMFVDRLRAPRDAGSRDDMLRCLLSRDEPVIARATLPLFTRRCCRYALRHERWSIANMSQPLPTSVASAERRRYERQHCYEYRELMMFIDDERDVEI